MTKQQEAKIMTTYRVDVNKSQTVPCGMNSIRYMGKSKAEALKVYNQTLIGFNSWHGVDSSYGVVLSSWSGKYSDSDSIIKTKGFNHE